jgi:hypothetical protein
LPFLYIYAEIEEKELEAGSSEEGKVKQKEKSET